jgi:hypothetical protein
MHGSEPRVLARALESRSFLENYATPQMINQAGENVIF